MPLSPPRERKLIHTRSIECHGYRRDDGLWDIEGHLTDTKTYGWHSDWRGEVKPGVPVHEMWLRLTLDDDLLVHDAEAASDFYPFRICPDIAPQFKQLKGLKIGAGWRRKVKELVGGVAGCTHLVELLTPLATAAFQTIYPLREKIGHEDGTDDNAKKPEILDTCHALASDSEVVKANWPAFYTGK